MDTRSNAIGADAGHGISFNEAFRVWRCSRSSSRVGKRALKNRIMIALSASADG